VFVLRTALNEIRRRLADPFAFALWLGIPITMFGMIYLAFDGLSGGGEAPTAELLVVDEDESTLSGLLVTALAAGGDFGSPVVAREVGPDEGRSLIENGKGTALLIIPAAFGDDLLAAQPTGLELVTNPTQSVLPQMVEESLRLLVDAAFYVERIFGDQIGRILDAGETAGGQPSDAEVAEISILINQTMRRLDSLLFPPVIELEVVRGDQEPGDEADGPGFVDIFFPAILFMALFFMAAGFSEDIWVEKHQGTLRRALATPNRPAAFLAGKLLGAAALIGVVCLAALLGAKYLLGAAVENLWLAFVWALVSGALFLLFLLALQLHATSQRAGGMLINLIMLPLLILGGTFFPFEVMPESLARIGSFTPNGWALIQLFDIVGGEIDPARLGIGLGALALAGALLFVIASRRMAGAFVRS